MPAAEKFEAWVFEEVLPAIRKHGMYFTQDTVADIFKKVKSPTNSIENGWLYVRLRENKKLEKELALAQPKVEYYEVGHQFFFADQLT